MAKPRIIYGARRDVEFVERLASVTEELENLVQISKGKRKLEDPIISKHDIASMFKMEKPEEGIPKSLLSVFRLLVVKNLLRGRLYTTAYNSGKEIGLSPSLKTKKDFIKIVKRLNLGRVEIVKFDSDDIKIKLYNGITALGIKHSHKPICFFEAGIFAGFSENIFRKIINLKETKCKAMGNIYCQFELTRSGHEMHKTHSAYPIDMYSEENLKLLTSLASHSITAIENAILFEKTRQQIAVDGLTQVYNHRYFHKRIDVEYKRAQRYSFPITLFMLDVDNFKSFNDKYGHPRGDEVLKAVSRALVKCLRGVDIVARYGGDEFAVVLPETNAQGAKIVAERIRKEISHWKLHIKKRKISVTISLGGITLEITASKAGKSSLIVELADKALLRAKKKGKNNIVLLKKT